VTLIQSIIKESNSSSSNNKIMPSTIVVAVPEGKEPSIASALLMVAAQEEQLLSASSGKIMSASSSAADVASSSSCEKRNIEGSADEITNAFEPLPKKIKRGDHHVEERGINMCSAEGCKNEPMIGGVCLVHGAKMSLLQSSDTGVGQKVGIIGRKISPFNEEIRGAASSSSDDAASQSSANDYQEGDDWPLTNIETPGKNDCLCGRGGGTNHHPGNKKYRKLVDCKKAVYLASARNDKPNVSLGVVHIWRAMNPPGRFLEQDKETKLWNDIGDEKAREKTSQALREKAPAPYVKKKEKRIRAALAIKSQFN